MKFELINTRRLQLRLVDQTVLDNIFSTYSNEELRSFFGETIAEKEIERYHGGSSSYQRSFLYFQLLLKGTNELIGWCGYHTWYTIHDRAEIGYMLFSDEHKNQGYMSETLEAVLSYGFKEMNLHRIEAMVGLFNEPSLRLLEKFGFEEEGRLKEHYYTGGVYEDSLVFGLVKP